MDQTAVDFSILENVKENIEPLNEGRSASSLARIFSLPSSELKEQQIEDKKKFEAEIAKCDELDDPIEPFVSYITWINNNFPSGPTISNGLISVLERCTDMFKDDSMYKNDPRFLKIWLMYAKYCENPSEIFVFLYRKQIGLALSIYYEEYAKLLELKQNYEQANQVYQRGLLVEAKPIRRLRLRYQEFKLRMEGLESNSLQSSENTMDDPFPKRVALGVKGGSILTQDIEEQQDVEMPDHTQTDVKIKSNPKMAIYLDSQEPEVSALMKTGGWDSLGTKAERTKENKLIAKPWAGEVLKQDQDAIKSRKKPQKVMVYQDSTDSNMGINNDVPFYKIVENVGKRTEKLDINMDLLYPGNNEEYSLNEVLALMRGSYCTRYNILDPQEIVEDKENMIDQDIKNPLKRDSSVLANEEKVDKNSIEYGNVSQNDEDGDDDDDDDDENNDLFNKLNNDAFGLVNNSDCDFDPDDHLEEPEPSPVKRPSQPSKQRLFSDHDTMEESSTSKMLLKESQIPSFKIKNDERDIQKSPTVTMTLFTKEANQEVYSMFNQNDLKRSSNQKDVNDTFSYSEEQYSETETQDPKEFLKRIGIKLNKESPLKQLSNFAEEKNDCTLGDSGNNTTSILKSVFTNSTSENDFLIFDPWDSSSNTGLLQQMDPGLENFRGVAFLDEKKSFLKKVTSNSRTFYTKAQNDVTYSNHGESYKVVKQLGVGGFGVVYLINSLKTFKSAALKIESPANPWEFYIIRTIHKRLEQLHEKQPTKDLYKVINHSVMDAISLNVYKDESHLLLNYEPQGNILDIINLIKNDPHNLETNFCLDESLVAFFSIEILKTVKYLHNIDVIHGDLKVENCLIKFASSKYDSERVIYDLNRAKSYLNDKGLTLIDFGRSIDLKFYPSHCKFKANLQFMDAQDCIEIQKNIPWKHEVDYYGLANVIYTMIFGSFIQTQYDSTLEKYYIDKKFKRYWTASLWQPIFDFLLNPGQYGEMPNTAKMDNLIQSLENWLYKDTGGYKNVEKLKNNIAYIEQLTRKMNK